MPARRRGGRVVRRQTQRALLALASFAASCVARPRRLVSVSANLLAVGAAHHEPARRPPALSRRARPASFSVIADAAAPIAVAANLAARKAPNKPYPGRPSGPTWPANTYRTPATRFVTW